MFKEQKLFYTNLFLAGVNAPPAIAPAIAPAVAPPAVAALPVIDPPAVAPPIVDLFKPIGCKLLIERCTLSCIDHLWSKGLKASCKG